jgi:hypothetical protein
MEIIRKPRRQQGPSIPNLAYLRTKQRSVSLLLAGYPFALVGHYDLYNPRTPRTMDYCPRQVRIVLSIIAVAVTAYLVTAIVR